jgi:hypothetical protein
MRLGQLPVTAAGLQLPRRVTQTLSGAAAREAHVEISLVERGISVRTMPGFEAWVAPVARAHEERHLVSGKARIVPESGWMVFFEHPDRPQRVAVLGRST